jgi:isopentenyl diphosphate isomerase/L-lactate dehydrogenase-like FMN-dependent dehydrogenase
MAIALGADLAGSAGSMLRAADEGEEALDAAVAEITDTLRIVMFCAGARDVGSLYRDAGLVERRGGAADPGAVLTGARLARRPVPREADAAGGTP